MSSTGTSTSSSNGSAPGTAQLEADIARQRDELAETVDALHAKLDVKARVRANPTPAVGAAVGLVLVIGLLVWRKRR